MWFTNLPEHATHTISAAAANCGREKYCGVFIYKAAIMYLYADVFFRLASRYKGFEFTIEVGSYVYNKHSNHNKACLGLLFIDSRCSFVFTNTHLDVVHSCEIYRMR